MAQAESFYLPAQTATCVLQEGLKNLSPRVTSKSPMRPFTLMDTCDGEIRRSGRLLFGTGQLLELLSQDDGISKQAVPSQGNMAQCTDGEVKAALQNISVLHAISRVGEGARQEVTLAFLDRVQKTRVRARLWVLTSPEGGAATLVVLEGLRGYDKSRNQLRKHLVTNGARQIGDPAFITALFPSQRHHKAKPDICMTHQEAAYDAANAIIKTYLAHARGNIPGIISDIDIEFLHDFRVALRKIRSVVSLFDAVYAPKTTRDLKARFSKVMSRTGDLRDLDVYLADKAHFYTLVPNKLHAGLDALFEHLAKQRATAQTDLRSYMQSDSFQREMEALAARFDRPILKKGAHADLPAQQYASRLIWKRYKTVCKIAAGIDNATEDAEVHRLRIQCKKLRYLIEIFAPVFPKKETKSILRALKRAQDTLGRFNDYAVQQESLHAMLGEWNASRGGANPKVARSIEALIRVLRGKQQKERRKVVARFAQFNDTKTRATCRALFRRTDAKRGA